MKFKRKTNFIKKKFARAAAAALVGVFIICIFSFVNTQKAQAEIAVNDLTIAVGYSGMELDEYVKLKTYTPQELEENFDLQEINYSYFQGNGTTTDDVYDSASYSSIVATGWGVNIIDLLESVNIYYGDIYNILFYVEDIQGIWTALDKTSLFDTDRYYFENMPRHASPIYNEFNVLTGWDFSDAWNFATPVEPMLALESNWDRMPVDEENVNDHYPNTASMNTSMRYRLLYGQTSPTERITRESAEYVSCVYVTLNGTPEFGEMPEMDTTIGSHTVETTISVGNEDIRDIISQVININSTNEDVLKVTGYTVTPVDDYTDLATIVIYYDIVGMGDASITASVGDKAGSESVEVANTSHSKSSEEPSSEAATEQESKAADDQAAEPTSKAADEQSTEPEAKSPETQTAETTASADAAPQTSSDTKTDADTASKTDTDTAENYMAQEADLIDSDSVQELNGGSLVYKIADNVIGSSNINDVIGSAVAVAPEEDIDQLYVEDNTEEEESNHRIILIFTGIGCLAVAGLGFGFGMLKFKLGLKTEPKAVFAKINAWLNKVFFGTR